MSASELVGTFKSIDIDRLPAGFGPVVLDHVIRIANQRWKRRKRDERETDLRAVPNKCISRRSPLPVREKQLLGDERRYLPPRDAPFSFQAKSLPVTHMVILAINHAVLEARP